MVAMLRSLLGILRKKQLEPIPVYRDNDQLLKSKIALIVGGGSGIGYSIAEAFVNSGAKVVLAGRNEEKLKKACLKLGQEESKYCVWDITAVNEVEKKIDKVCGLFPENKIDILVNSVGVHCDSSFETITEEEFDSVIKTNLKGVFFLDRAIGIYMRKNHIKGHILNISSSSALRPAWGPYQMSKWALNGYTQGLAKKFQEYGIVVNAIAPGQTATPMLNKDGHDIAADFAQMGRYIMPVEIANLAVILCSDIGNIVIGDTLYATGGSGLLTMEK